MNMTSVEKTANAEEAKKITKQRQKPVLPRRQVKQAAQKAQEHLLGPSKPRPIILSNLPASLSEKRFLKLVQPMPAYEFFRYEQPTVDSESRTSSACIRFKTLNDVYLFRERFEDYFFIDAQGTEYRVNIEFAPYQPPVSPRHERCHLFEEQFKRDPIYQKFLNALAKERAAARKRKARKLIASMNKPEEKPTWPINQVNVKPVDARKILEEAFAKQRKAVLNSKEPVQESGAKQDAEQGKKKLQTKQAIRRRRIGKSGNCLDKIARDIKKLKSVIQRQMRILKRKSEASKVEENKSTETVSPPISQPTMICKSVPIYTQRRDTVAWYLKKCC